MIKARDPSHDSESVAPEGSVGQSAPTVTCIMPTRDRRPFVPQAILYFLRQDHEPRELIIIDNGDDAIKDLIPDDHRIRYVQSDKRESLGAHRNHACELASGELIAHWDDDDWMSSNRLSVQITALEVSGRSICGTSNLLYYHIGTRQAFLYKYPNNQPPWIAGGTFLYRRDVWAKHPFAERTIGEDTIFVRRFLPAEMLVMDDSSFYVGLIHGHNTSKKNLRGARWQKQARQKVTDLLGRDLAFYDDRLTATKALRPASGNRW